MMGELVGAAILVMLFPAFNALLVLFWYNALDMWRNGERGTLLVLSVILAYVITLVCALFDATLVYSVVMAISMLT